MASSNLIVRYRTFLTIAPCVAVFFGCPVVVLQEQAWLPASAWQLDIAAGWVLLVAIARATGARLLSDARGRWSLSRVQLIFWSSLLLPTIWTMAVARILGGAADPVALDVDENLWLLLGISVTSFVASPLILQRKQTRAPGILDVPATAGIVDGGLRDLFRGEDAGNAQLLDLGRVQVAFFTVVTLCVYFVACRHAFATEHLDALVFPPVSGNLIALLGISHATYLVNKNLDYPATTATTPTKG